jgi:hypothetical protein
VVQHDVGRCYLKSEGHGSLTLHVSWVIWSTRNAVFRNKQDHSQIVFHMIIYEARLGVLAGDKRLGEMMSGEQSSNGAIFF